MWKEYLDNMTEEDVEKTIKDTVLYKRIELAVALLKFKIEFFQTSLFKHISKNKIKQWEAELADVEQQQRDYVESLKAEMM